MGRGLHSDKPFNFLERLSGSKYGLYRKSWVFLNITDGHNDPIGTSKVNPGNRKVGRDLINSLVEAGFKSIKYVTPYNGQKQAVTSMMQALRLPENVNIDVATVDVAQGSEADVVIFDLVSAAHKSKSANFVRSYNRLNVSLTRAKYGLVFIGSKGSAEHLSDPANAKRHQFYDYIVTVAIREDVFCSLTSDSRPVPEGLDIMRDPRAKTCRICREYGHIAKEFPECPMS